MKESGGAEPRREEAAVDELRPSSLSSTSPTAPDSFTQHISHSLTTDRSFHLLTLSSSFNPPPKPPLPTRSPPLINSLPPFISLQPPVEALHSLHLFFLPLVHSPLTLSAPSQAFSLIPPTVFFSLPPFHREDLGKVFNRLQQMGYALLNFPEIFVVATDFPQSR